MKKLKSRKILFQTKNLIFYHNMLHKLHLTIYNNIQFLKKIFLKKKIINFINNSKIIKIIWNRVKFKKWYKMIFNNTKINKWNTVKFNKKNKILKIIIQQLNKKLILPLSYIIYLRLYKHLLILMIILTFQICLENILYNVCRE